MSKGIGTAQREILAALRDSEARCMAISGLAAITGRSARHVRTAVASLERREMVVTTRGSVGWKGEGEYGRLVRTHRWDGQTLPVAKVVRKGEQMPHSTYGRRSVAPWDVELGRQGMPVFGTLVWLPERRAEAEAESAARVARFAARLRG
jgi:hypothetical protein